MFSSLHPQLEDLLEINWDDRWNHSLVDESNTAYRYDKYFEISAEDHDMISTEDTRKCCFRNTILFSVTTAIVSGLAINYQFASMVIGALFTGAVTAKLCFNSSSSKEWLSRLCSPRACLSNTIVIKNNFHDVDAENTFLLFVYGTLKRDFQWNQKYLHQRQDSTTVVPYARFVATAITKQMHLLSVGDCGVPYLSLLSPDEAGTVDGCGCVVGELWEVSEDCLRNLDDYEGVSKGYYRRDAIDVCLTGQGLLSNPLRRANVYHLVTPLRQLKNVATVVMSKNNSADGNAITIDSEPKVEYTLKMHTALYNAVRHIQVKQMSYIHHTPSTWGHTHKPAIHISTEAAAATESIQ